MRHRLPFAIVLASGSLHLGVAPTGHAQTVERLNDGVALAAGGRRLEVRACRDGVMRVLDAPPGPFFARRSLITVPEACRPTRFEVKTGASSIDVITERLVARIALPGGAVTFLDRQGR